MKRDKHEYPDNSFLSLLSAPARRGLVAHQITTIEKLAQHTEKEVLAIHGVGPSSIPKLRKALEENGYSFKQG